MPGQGGKIVHHLAATGGATAAAHRERLLFHGGRVVETNLFVRFDIGERHQVAVIFDSCIRVAGMVHINGGWEGVEVFIRPDLEGHAFPGSARFGFGEANGGPLEAQNDLGASNETPGEDAQADVARSEVEVLVRIPLGGGEARFKQGQDRRLSGGLSN